MKYIIYGACSTAILLIVLTASFYYFTHIDSRNIQTTILNIDRGESVRAISRKLKKENIVNNDTFFLLYVLIKGYQKRLKAGEYEFAGKYTIDEIVSKLVNHEIKLRKVTVPEGLTLSEIGDIFDKNALFKKSEFMDVINDDSLKSQLLDEGVNSFEGLLFPDTYYYWRGIEPQQIVEMMINRKNEIIKEIEKENGGKASLGDMKEYEIMILASIIEKESSFDAERDLVSSVFHNRLKIGMKLDSDPTVIYGLGDKFEGNLRKSDLEMFTEYNTYLIPGLPPTPIANPGKSSIYAALYPAETNYLYFVSRGDGTHYFSRNYAEHRKAVYQYQINSKKN